MNHWHETSDGLTWRGPSADPGMWAIRWAGVTPGLYWKPAGHSAFFGPFLGSLGLTAHGKGESGNLSQACLGQIEIVRDRVELTFLPPGWHDTSVRFAWSYAGNHQFDLQVQASTRSLETIQGVEVGVVSSAWSVSESVDNWLVATRDEAAAMRSIDGRQADWLAAQSAFEVDESVTGHGEARDWPPTLLTNPKSNISFLETAHPFDISRRYRDAHGLTQQTWSLGYNMERGIILRSRFRGRLVASGEQADWSTIHNWQSAFLAEPLPLDR